MPFTNRGLKVLMNTYYRADATDEPTAFKVALCTSATTPTATTNVLADLTEVTAGNGYTAGGASVARSAVGFDSIVENDTDNRAEIQLADVVWTASGGNLPVTAARWAVLLDDEATPNVIAYWDLGADRQVSDTFLLTITNLELRISA